MLCRGLLEESSNVLVEPTGFIVYSIESSGLLRRELLEGSKDVSLEPTASMLYCLQSPRR